jgi:hypothetical protein
MQAALARHGPIGHIGPRFKGVADQAAFAHPLQVVPVEVPNELARQLQDARLVLGLRGSLGSGVAASSIAALIPAMAAMFAGQWLRSRISADFFRSLFFAGLLALGGLLLMKG